MAPEDSIGVCIATSVSFEFFNPPVAILSGCCAVGWAGVPEAAIHEHRDSLGREDNVGSALVADDCSVNEEPQSHPMECRAYC